MNKLTRTLSGRRNFLALSSLMLGLASYGCTASEAPANTSAGLYLSAMTGEECVPDDTLVPAEPSGEAEAKRGGHNSPTGIPGDNIDDEHSGKIDCYYDGNSGQGDDRKHGCDPTDFPQPGCDSNGCCADEVIPDGPADSPTDDDPDGSEYEEPTGDEGTDGCEGYEQGCPSDPPVCADPEAQACSVDEDCGQHFSCQEGCCVSDVVVI